MCTIASIDRDELITFFALWFLSSVFFGSFVMLMSLWVYNLFSKIFTPKAYKLPEDYFSDLWLQNQSDNPGPDEREIFND